MIRTFRNLVALVRLIGLVGMPIASVKIAETNPKLDTFQYQSKRLVGLRLVIPDAAGVSSVSNNRIVSIQEVTATKELVAVISPVELASHKLIGWGVLENALQSGGTGSIAPTPNTYVDGDTVVVLRDIENIYMIDNDPSNVPTHGIGTAYIDAQGRLSSSSAGSNLLISGAVFTGVPGLQLSNQLKLNCVFYQMFTPLEP